MPDIPFLVESASSVDVVTWTKENLPFIEKQLTLSGAVLLRGFAQPSQRHFREVVEICSDPHSSTCIVPRQGSI